MATVRSILSIAANERMHLIQFDVCSSFLYGKLEEAIYMQQPEGYSDGTDRVCKLKRSLYGLKQASRYWNKHFGEFFFLSELGFKTSEADSCLYIRDKDEKKLIVCMWMMD
ncbi:hypothetical protein AVEN_172951-1 [Araneus ventricosus]|uniref:Reverse transcriptase Ty1/copia-type domain-containing protein n=1 Tax=Araneus ventricosus TaxID=182803 RepID=A0A4Y2W5K7_ARAVE|nr:hypothetical protein AVEN_172951-1 [Araneus ventricosus]